MATTVAVLNGDVPPDRRERTVREACESGPGECAGGPDVASPRLWMSRASNRWWINYENIPFDSEAYVHRIRSHAARAVTQSGDAILFLTLKGKGRCLSGLERTVGKADRLIGGATNGRTTKPARQAASAAHSPG